MRGFPLLDMDGFLEVKLQHEILRKGFVGVYTTRLLLTFVNNILYPL